MPPPIDGFVTTVNPRKVKPTMQRGVPTWGWCYQKAGWQVRAERTKARKLVMLYLTREQLLEVEPVAVRWNLGPLFGGMTR